MSLINAALLTPMEALDQLEEYEQYHAEGPPYPDPNGAVLWRRDEATIEALLARYREQ